MDVTGHDADLALEGERECSPALTPSATTYGIGCDDSGTVRADQPRFVLRQQAVLHLHHVVLGNAFGDGDDQRHFGVESFDDGLGGAGRRNVDDGGIGSSC